MTDDSRSGGRDGSGARKQGGKRPMGHGGGARGGSGGRSGDRFRSGSGRGEGQQRGDRGSQPRGERDERKRGDRPFRAEGDKRSGSGKGFDRGRRSDRKDQQNRRGGQDKGRRPDRRDQAEPKEPAPELPDSVSYSQLPGEIRRELATLPRTLAEVVGRHMVMAGQLLDEDPEKAYEHAVYARRKASRIGAVREAAGAASYVMGKWQEALSDLRAARRMTGRSNFLAMIADCERGLGRPERALEVTRDPEAGKLDAADRIELRIVASGARRDLGQTEAALMELQVPELKERRARPWVARLFYAYADVLLELGRKRDAREYFARASAVDREGVTDADERLAELEGVEIVDVDDDVVWTDAEVADEDDEPAAQPEESAAESTPSATETRDEGEADARGSD